MKEYSGKGYLEKKQKNFKKRVKQWLGCVLIGSLIAGNSSIMAAASGSGESTLPSGITYNDIGAEIEQFIEKNKDTTTGLEVAVFDREQVIYRNNYGYADVENQLPMENDTVLEWGSVSKLMVWISVMQLWEQGKLDLNEDIRTYLPQDFMKNLKYDTPITMLHLMNHNAGFQEMFIDGMLEDKERVLSLEEQLQRHQPEQVYEPGTITAYSNWGTALAGYIVERISGQSFDVYVNEHIFDLLGMEHTAISVDLSDNVWVQEKRKELKCYDTVGEPMGNCFFHVTLYPSGSCMGTLDDMVTFAQALLQVEGENTPLFEKQETLQEFLSPTSYYGDSDVPLNYHGFWGEIYEVEVLSHGGNTTGSTAQFSIEPESGVGMVVMINQKEKDIYKEEMQQLVFGNYSESGFVEKVKPAEFGMYCDGRSVMEGPVSVSTMMNMQLLAGEYITEFHMMTKQNGVEKITISGGDYIKLSEKEYIPRFLITYGWMLGILYAAITLVAGGCIVTPLSRAWRKKKGLEARSFAGYKWNYISCSTMVLLGISVARLSSCLMGNAPSESYRWQFVLSGVLGIAMMVLLVIWIMRGKEWNLTKREKAKLVITAIFLIITMIAICYWDMYKFWQIA